MYSKEILELVEKINDEVDLIDVNFKFEKSNKPPTQASSEFLTNKEQGDWAEKTILSAINKYSKDYVAVMYGLGDNLVAGEDGFTDFFEKYQNELERIGKRPDLLIFKKSDYKTEWNHDIRNFSDEELDEIVPKAVSGFEVRSSSFLITKYNQYMSARLSNARDNIFRCREEILSKYSDLLKKKNHNLFNIIQDLINEDNLDTIDFRRPNWRSTQELDQLSDLLKELKDNLKDIHKRSFLSITPKTEDLALVLKWIQKYNVQHYYIQVFFDKAYGISFKSILNLLLTPDLEDKAFSIEKDVKNQHKTTVKINTHRTNEIAGTINLPKHNSAMRELGRGRLLFYVTFEKSEAYLDAASLNELVGYNLI